MTELNRRVRTMHAHDQHVLWYFGFDVFCDNRHHLPHIHVRYQGEEAALTIDDGTVLDGSLPRKQLKMV